MNRSNLAKRVIFALWAIPLGWWIINSSLPLLPVQFTSRYFADPNMIFRPAHLATIVVALLGASEYIRMLSFTYPRNGFWLIYIWLLLQFLSHFVPRVSLSVQFDTYILLLLVAAEAVMWGKHTGRWKRASLLFSGTIFLSIAGISLLNLYREPFQLIFPPMFDHPMLTQIGLVVVLGAIFLCDSSAYFAGSFLGKHHFSSISPKKTVEGSVAGLAAAVIVSLLGWIYFADDRFPWYLGLGMGIIIGIFAQLGDLLVSLIKRYFRVKDASHIIPGHGGILDRFDSVFFTAPILNLYLIVISRSMGL